MGLQALPLTDLLLESSSLKTQWYCTVPELHRLKGIGTLGGLWPADNLKAEAGWLNSGQDGHIDEGSENV
jgi:hypothetical protein